MPRLPSGTVIAANRSLREGQARRRIWPRCYGPKGRSSLPQRPQNAQPAALQVLLANLMGKGATVRARRLLEPVLPLPRPCKAQHPRPRPQVALRPRRTRLREDGSPVPALAPHSAGSLLRQRVHRPAMRWERPR